MAETKPDWVKIKPQELEKIIIELYDQGNSPAKIGLILRDKHGIPKAKLLGKKISKILRDNNKKVETIQDIESKKIKKLETHIEKNIHDYSAKRSLTKKLWIVNTK